MDYMKLAEVQMIYIQEGIHTGSLLRPIGICLNPCLKTHVEKISIICKHFSPSHIENVFTGQVSPLRMLFTWL